ncbi:MAG TPA: 4Fe-4S binding protein, partial [bacterium (Candidatus Stahlbacteria)]|nr:4Fe-4S binding protein [Candidatus Stahlbacteria bacterium]
FGRMVCGWICPFGFLQDLMYRIRSFKIRIPKPFRYLKYGWLTIVAILVPYLTGVTWFSRLCPQGAIQAGIPLALGNEEIRGMVGGLFALKIGILVVFLFLFVVSKRPFCVTTCPLGAIYSLFNRISLIRLEINKQLCNRCGLCLEVCPTAINPCEDLDSVDCIRCLECKKVCPHDAIDIKAGLLPSAVIRNRRQSILC